MGDEPVAVPSQDVFTIVLSLPIPDPTSTSVGMNVGPISVCSSSWKHPNIREYDDPPTSTQILLSLGVTYDVFYNREIHLVTYQLQFCPLSNSSTTVNGGANDHVLTYQRRSPPYVHDREGQKFLGLSLTSATRTGRVIRLFRNLERNLGRTVYAINMYDFFAGAADDPQVAGSLSSVEQLSGDYRLSDGIVTYSNDGFFIDPMLEEYSGAFWYCRGKTFCIYYFD